MHGTEEFGRIPFGVNRIHCDDVFAATARAPCKAFIPTPPVPMTTTVSPGSVPADIVAEPQPVLTPHDTSEAAWKGIVSSILMTGLSDSTAYSANVPSCP